MAAAAQTIQPRSRIPVKSVALPIEHGAWGFLFEPLLAGVILAPSLAAPFISLFVVGAFLSRQPLKFLIGDWMQKRRLPRTEIARRFSLIFCSIAAAGLLGSLIFAPSHSLLPFAAVAPVVVFLIIQDVGRQSRELVPELGAALALASSIAVVALADGIGTALAAALWAAMIARLVPSVLYVRERIKLEKGKAFSRFWSHFAHVAAVLLVAALYYSGLGSALTVLMSAFLAGRAVYGLSGSAPKMSAKVLGIREVIYGVIYALAIVVGYYTGI
jgi:hypothetical protein